MMKWSRKVTSNALDLEEGIFVKKSPHQIGLSLKHSADFSTRRKSSPFQSAMSMLNFSINRAGRNLSLSERKRLEKAKIELRKLYGKGKK